MPSTPDGSSASTSRASAAGSPSTARARPTRRRRDGDHASGQRRHDQEESRRHGSYSMKLMTYDAGGGPRVGVLRGERVVDAGFDGDMVAFIEAGGGRGGGGGGGGAALAAPP